MSKTLVLVLIATLFLFTHAARETLDEDLQLQHLIDWYKSQTCGSPFLYDENFGGPGNVPPQFIDIAQNIADNLFEDGVDDTNLTNFVLTQSCAFSQYISQTELSFTRVNVHNAIVEITYEGPLVEVGRTLLNNAEFNRIRRCPRYDNYAFGLRIDDSTNPETIHFVIVAVASDPTSLCTGSNTQLTATSQYLCNSICTQIDGVTGDINYIPTPTHLAESLIESNDEIVIWKELDTNIYVDQTVDLYSLGKTRPVTFFTPKNNDIKSVTPNDGDPASTIPAGTHLISWFLKFDPVGTSNTNSTQVRGSVIFSTPVIGAIFTQQKPLGSRTRLADTDPTFKTLCVTYDETSLNDPAIFRGLEYSSILRTQEGLTIYKNVFTVDNFEAKGRGVDNVRIFTSCPYGPACDIAVNATLNVIIINPPLSIGPGHLQSNTDVYLFRERSWILSHDLPVDHIVPSYPDNYNIELINLNDPDPVLNSGVAVTSWYFHAETVGTVFTNYTAAATFKDKIRAFIFRAINPPQNAGHETLRKTDPLFGDHCTEYGPGFNNPQSFRGLEFTTADSLNVDATGYRLDFILRVTKGQDDFRVLTQCDT